jgi:hypothetical protein
MQQNVSSRIKKLESMSKHLFRSNLGCNAFYYVENVGTRRIQTRDVTRWRNNMKDISTSYGNQCQRKERREQTKKRYF